MPLQERPAPSAHDHLQRRYCARTRLLFRETRENRMAAVLLAVTVVIQVWPVLVATELQVVVVEVLVVQQQQIQH